MDVELSCDESDGLLAAAALAALPAGEDEAVRAHLGSCARCRRAGSDYRATADHLAFAAPRLEPPTSLKQSLMAEVYADAARRQGVGRLAGFRSMVRGRFLRRLGVAAGGGLAALVAAALVITMFHVRVVSAPSPLAVEYAVTSTPVQPLVRGALFYDPASKRGVVDVQGLLQPPANGPQQAPGTYELWLIRSDGATLPAGYLGLQPDGRTWSTAIVADLRRYHSVAATLERPGGSTTPQGQTVFTVLFNRTA